MGRSTWSCAAVILLLAAVRTCGAVTLESIHWSSSNAKFAPGQGLVLFPQIGDKMDIVCPRVDASLGGKEEFYKVYLVSRRQLESCIIDKTDTPLLNCDKPRRDVKFTFKFQEFSPNLWGLEFLKGRDYYITSTSTGSLQGLDNTNGGACKTKSMKLVLRVGQNSSDAPSTLQESPTRFPPTRPKSKAKDASTKESVKNNNADVDPDAGRADPGGGSEPGLLVWIASGCVAVLLAAVILIAVAWRCRHRRRRRHVPDSQQPASVSLNTLAVQKRDSISSDNNGSDRSDVVFPLRPSESMICRHYERVSSDYGPPVYIVQEITPQSPTNVYYKV
ncbi:ephrin-B2a-like [Salarias fasciatus]|uniref:ephrin-B2a-like n=1 Tax=Salarias fasciatus TaxID=181472 RepID=UPI001176F3EE|nr:ephrin-B2a-like [Salarias fasciatus]